MVVIDPSFPSGGMMHLKVARARIGLRRPSAHGVVLQSESATGDWERRFFRFFPI